MKNLTAKNIKTFNTNDGYAWSASFYLDGKKIGTARNGGYGGPSELNIEPGALKIISDFADSDPEYNQFKIERTEYVFETCMENELARRKIKRILKTKVVAKIGGDIFEWKTPKGHTMDVVKNYVMTKHKNAIILNDLTPDKAYELYAEI